MTGMNKVERKERIIGRLRHGADLLEEITGLCKQKGIRLGWISGLGAAQKARIGYYDQNSKQYEYIELDQHLEITNLTGNVSIRDGAPVVHAHINLADSSGRAYGGHLAPGTIVFACELSIEVLDGAVPEKKFDQETGLALWPIE